MVQQTSRKISEFDAVTGPGPFVTVGNRAGVTYRFPTSLYAIDPCAETYGARGDGSTDDLGALLLAIAAGVSSGRPVCGFGRTYGISGNLTLVANAWLQDISLKQLSPAGSTRRTLTSSGGDNIKLINVVVDRNGTGEYGVHQSSSGVYIDGGSGHYFENVEVFGDDIGGGFFLINATDCDLVRVHTHDINYLLGADPGNDRVMGIYLNSCSRVRLSGCSAHDLGGDFGGGYTLRWSRGFAYSGCTDIQHWGCITRMVDQGYDATGGVNNTRFQFTGCFAVDCFTWGFKFANTARDCQVTGCTAERCYLSGFVVSGPSGPVTGDNGSSDIDFVGCVAYDTGAPGLPGTPEPGGKVGFRVMHGNPLYDMGTTLGVRFIGCKAHDRQDVHTMAYGFQQDSDASAIGVLAGKYNEVIDCISIGHLGAAFQDMHQARCEVSRALVQSIPSGVWTPVEWTQDVDLGAMHSTSSVNENIYARRQGNYRSIFGAVFPANGSGERSVRLLRNGSVVSGSLVVVKANSAGQTALQTVWTSQLVEGDTLQFQVKQDSGVALDLQIDSGGVVEQVP